MAEAQSKVQEWRTKKLRTIAGTKNFRMTKNYRWQSLTRLLLLSYGTGAKRSRLPDNDPPELTTDFKVI